MTSEIINNGYISFEFIVGDIVKTVESVLKIPSRSIDVNIVWTATRSKIALSKESVDLLSDKSLMLRIDQYKQVGVGEFHSSLGTGEINSGFLTIPEVTRNTNTFGSVQQPLTYNFKFIFLDEFGNDFKQTKDEQTKDIHMYNGVASIHLCESC